MSDKDLGKNDLVMVGEKDLVLGFSALGFKPYGIKSPEEFKSILKELLDQGTCVCLVQEEIYRANQIEIENFKAFALPVFIPFVKRGEINLLNNIIREIKIRATGAL